MPLEPEQLADALDAFWNASLGHLRSDIYASGPSFEVIGAIAAGFAAVSEQLRLIALQNAKSVGENEVKSGSSEAEEAKSVVTTDSVVHEEPNPVPTQGVTEGKTPS